MELLYGPEEKAGVVVVPSFPVTGRLGCPGFL
jgi:hypothetical protein